MQNQRTPVPLPDIPELRTEIAIVAVVEAIVSRLLEIDPAANVGPIDEALGRYLPAGSDYFCKWYEGDAA